METTPRKELTISSEVNTASVVLRFEDTGVGVSDPSQLFRPFNEPGATGLGLYISRAILRSFHGDLQHEERAEGCSFAVTLERFVSSEDDGA
jgi:C4-dicarboxylate-specific signal transduction histidine kinase